MSHVLIVDDAPSIAALTREILEFEGYTAQTVSSVSEALKAVLAQTPDVILCDWRLPDGTAEDVIAAVGDALRIIIYSGSKPEDVVLKRVAGFLMKPCATHILLAKLAEVLARD